MYSYLEMVESAIYAYFRNAKKSFFLKRWLTATKTKTTVRKKLYTFLAHILHIFSFSELVPERKL